MSPTDFDTWSRILWDYKDEAVEWSFDNWTRNGTFFPRPSEILVLLQSFSTRKVLDHKYCGHCDTGWVRGFKDKAGNDAVKRCECMKVTA